MIDSIKISDEQINAYYEANKSTFLSSPRAEVYHIFINTSNPDYLKSMIVSETDLQNNYNQNKSRFTEPEQVKASHILIKPRGEGDDEKRFEEAKNVIQALYEKAKNGEDFAKLAGEYTDDPGSKSTGGLYTGISVGSFVKPYEDAVFAVADGEVYPELVESDYGYHIVKREKVETKNEKPTIITDDIYNDFMQNVGQELIDKAEVETSNQYIAIDYKTFYQKNENN